MTGRRCCIEISREALARNLAATRSLLPPETGVVAIVKADAYGHGVARVVPELSGKVAMFAVACLAEAEEVRAIDPDTPILLLSPCLPEERAGAAARGFLPVISSLDEAAAYAALGAPSNPVRVHLAIDTGMGRIGLWEEEAETVCQKIAALESLRIEAIASHLPCADEDPAFTDDQIARFDRLAARLREKVFSRHLPRVHLLNSAGILRGGAGVGDLVRAGLMLYGASPLADPPVELHPVMTFKSRIILVRDIGAGRGINYGRTFISERPMRVATISAGYADGYPRALSNRGAQVLIGGKRCDVLGRVTMDQIVVDVSDVPEASTGDEAVLLGAQGSGQITAGELATRAGTIPWEIFTSIGNGARSRRVVV